MKIAPLLQLREHGFLLEYHYRHRFFLLLRTSTKQPEINNSGRKFEYLMLLRNFPSLLVWNTCYLNQNFHFQGKASIY